MKKIILFFFLILATLSQVGFGTTEPRAKRDIVAADKDTPTNIDGILIPRLKKFPSKIPNVHGTE